MVEWELGVAGVARLLGGRRGPERIRWRLGGKRRWGEDRWGFLMLLSRRGRGWKRVLQGAAALQVMRGGRVRQRRSGGGLSGGQRGVTWQRSLANRVWVQDGGRVSQIGQGEKCLGRIVAGGRLQEGGYGRGGGGRGGGGGGG